MDYGKISKIDFSLESLSTIAVATKFWDKPNIQRIIEEYFNAEKPRTEWTEIVKEVMKQVDLLPFPNVILSYIKSYVPLIGKNIRNWIKYVIDEWHFPIKYAKKIYWTPYGTIDELKIVNEFWLMETDLLAVKYHDYLTMPLFSIAAIYAREDFIRENIDEMKTDLNKLVAKGRKKKIWTVENIISTWLVFHSSPSRPDALKRLGELKNNSDDLSIKTVFHLCVEKNYRFAAKYFWDKLTVNEKQHSMMKAVDELFSHNGDLEKSRVELLIFFINQMSDLQISDFLSRRFATFFETLIQVWPYQNLCLNLLNQNIEYDCSDDDIKKSWKCVMKYLTCTKERMQIRNKSIYHMIFQKLLERISVEQKLDYFVNANLNLFYNSFKNFDGVTISLILNDADLKMYKGPILLNFQWFIKYFIINERYDDLEVLIDNFSEKQKKIFKEKHNLLTVFIMSGKFRSADNHLKWLYKSEIVRSAVKNKLNSHEICRGFIRNHRFDLANEFLEWQFDTEEERRNVKKDLKEAVEILQSEIYKIWGTRNLTVDVHLTKDKCSEMLKWNLESDSAVIEFKRNKLIKNDSCIVKYWKSLLHGSFVDLDNFLEFCLRTPEEIDEIKRSVGENIKWWIDTFILDDIKMINSLLDWVFDNDTKKKVFADYLNSPTGALLCINICKNYAHLPDLICEFFNVGGLYFTLIEMKMNLDLFDKNIATDSLKSLIVDLLEKRINGQEIRNYHMGLGYYSKVLEQIQKIESSEASLTINSSDKSKKLKSGETSDDDRDTISGNERDSSSNSVTSRNFLPRLAAARPMQTARKSSRITNKGRRIITIEESGDTSEDDDRNDLSSLRPVLAARKAALITNTGRRMMTEGSSTTNIGDGFPFGGLVQAARKRAPITNTGRRIITTEVEVTSEDDVVTTAS